MANRGREFASARRYAAAVDVSAWLSIAAVLASGAVSPGPSLAVVVKNTVARGRREGVLTGLGHGLGVGLYAFAVVAGLHVLLHGWEHVITTVGALYLVWMGANILVATWRAKPSGSGSAGADVAHSAPSKTRSGFVEGFFVAFLNPKIAVFFLALLSQFVPAEASVAERAGVAVLAMSIDGGWYVFAAAVLGAEGVSKQLARCGVWLDRLFGALIAGLGVWMLVHEFVGGAAGGVVGAG